MSDRFGLKVGLYPEGASKDEGIYLEGPTPHATDILLTAWQSMGGWREKGITTFGLTVEFRDNQTVRFVLTRPGQEFAAKKGSKR